MDTRNEAGLQPEQLPFDPWTIAQGLWRRRLVFALIAVLAICTGALGGLKLGSKTYKAQTVLLHSPVDGNSESPALLTQMNMIKIRSNLETVRRTLELEARLDQLGTATDVRVGRDTSLLHVEVTWNDPRQAARIANALRDVFLHNQDSLRRIKTERHIDDLGRRLETVNSQLAQAGQLLQEFESLYQVVDLDKEAQWYLEELTTLEIMIEQAQIEDSAIKLQTRNIDRIIGNLRQRVLEERADAAGLGSLDDTNNRLRRLRDAINDDRQHRAMLTELAEREAEVRRARAMKEKVLSAQTTYEEAVIAYDKQKALSEDTQQVKAWKEEIERLGQIVISSSTNGTPSGRLLQEMMLRAFDIELKAVALDEKVTHLQKATERVRKKLHTLPKLRLEQAELTREVEAKETQRQGLEKLLGDAQRIYESDLSDFLVVADAVPPIFAASSSRRMLAIGIAALVFIIGFSITLVVELFESSIRSPAELSLKLRLPVLTSIPVLGRFADSAMSDHPAARELFRFAAHRIRGEVSRRGARVLVTAAQHAEGATFVATSLAACFGRQGERVLLVKPSTHSRAQVVLTEHNEQVNPDADPEAFFDTAVGHGDMPVSPSIYRGVDLLSGPDDGLDPDLVASKRMGELLERVSRNYDLIIIDVPCVLQYADAQALSQWVDGIVLVVRSRMQPIASLRKALECLKLSGKPIIGSVLNAVEPAYLTGA